MKMVRTWKYRIYPSKEQEEELNRYLYEGKNLWNNLLGYTKEHYEGTGKFPTNSQLHLKTKGSPIFSQVAQNIADRITDSLKGMIARKNAGRKAGFPRFKSYERMRSFTYTQFGFRLGNRLELSKIGSIAIRKHRDIRGTVKTLTIKKAPSGRWFSFFTSEIESIQPPNNQKPIVGIDLGVKCFGFLSNEEKIENPRHLLQAEENLKKRQRQLSRKSKGSKNRKKAKKKVAIAHEKVRNQRTDFLHKISRTLASNHSIIALENLNIVGLARGFLAKHVLDCGWAEFLKMLHYKAEEAGCEVILVNPANTTSECSSCGRVQKKSLAERQHVCHCGAFMDRDLNAAINILNRATSGTGGS